MESILFIDDHSQPLGYRLREAWLMQFPRRPLTFYFCEQDEEYERLLTAGPTSNNYAVVTDPNKMTVLQRCADDLHQAYLVFVPDLKFLETARLGHWSGYPHQIVHLREQVVLAIFPKGFENTELVYDIYPEAVWKFDPLVFPDLEQIEEWRAELAAQS